MSIKTELLTRLEEAEGVYLSGEDLGKRLHCTRAAVCKAVKALREEGYTILSTTNRGYALTGRTMQLSADGIGARLEKRDVPVTVLETTDSTNRRAKQAALAENAPHGTVIAAQYQTQGSGRQGRSFYSPRQTGLYFSVVLRPRRHLADGLFLTAAAAVAACRAMEELFQISLSIKWVNDLYRNGKKVGGILTEAVTDFETGAIEFAVVGIGLNLFEPAGGFPEELARRAGAVFAKGASVDRNQLLAGIVNRLLEEIERPGLSSLYVEKNLVPGHMVQVTTAQRAYKARALEILPDGRLVVEEQGGKREALRFGDVSICM